MNLWRKTAIWHLSAIHGGFPENSLLRSITIACCLRYRELSSGFHAFDDWTNHQYSVLSTIIYSEHCELVYSPRIWELAKHTIQCTWRLVIQPTCQEKFHVTRRSRFSRSSFTCESLSLHICATEALAGFLRWLPPFEWEWNAVSMFISGGFRCLYI